MQKLTLKTAAACLMMLMTTTIKAQQAPQLRADNIDDVMKAMTLEEKAKLLVGGANKFFSSSAVMITS